MNERFQNHHDISYLMIFVSTVCLGCFMHSCFARPVVRIELTLIMSDHPNRLEVVEKMGSVPFTTDSTIIHLVPSAPPPVL
jgi:hypothetical protein